jgi:hypothetical protein
MLNTNNLLHNTSSTTTRASVHQVSGADWFTRARDSRCAEASKFIRHRSCRASKCFIIGCYRFAMYEVQEIINNYDMHWSETFRNKLCCCMLTKWAAPGMVFELITSIYFNNSFERFKYAVYWTWRIFATSKGVSPFRDMTFQVIRWGGTRILEYVFLVMTLSHTEIQFSLEARTGDRHVNPRCLVGMFSSSR